VLGIKKEYDVDDAEFVIYYFSTGVPLIVLGLRRLKKTITAISNRSNYENLKIEEYDEWNIMVRLHMLVNLFGNVVIPLALSYFHLS